MLKQVFNLYVERSDFFLPLVVEHLTICGIAILIATVIGVGFGILISEHKKLSVSVLGVTNFLYTIPSIALLGFLIPFSGIGNVTAVIALTIYGLLPMVRNTYVGLTNIDPDILEAAMGMGSTKAQMLFKIKLPLATPVILSGFRNMVVMMVSMAGVASFIGAGGLGVAIYRGITTNNSVMTIAGSLAVAAMAITLDGVVGLVKYFSERWRSVKVIPITAGIMAFCALFSFAYMNSPKEEAISIASKPMTEQMIITEIMSILIEENTDIKVEITKGVGGGTSNIHPALVKGDFDMYPEYTGTAWANVLKKTEIPDDETLFKQLVDEYKDEYSLNWKGLYGFDNTYAIAVRDDVAKKYNLKTYSDIAKISDKLTIAANYDFYERDDGYPALEREYGFKFNTIDMDMGLKYSALLNGKTDAIIAATTDGQLSVPGITVLEDDKGLFKHYYCGTVVRSDTLDKHPELERVLMLMDGLISSREMAAMNYKVETHGMTDRDVAREFLIQKGLI